MGVAINTVRDVVISYARQLNKKPPIVPVVLGIDEIHMPGAEDPYAVIGSAKSRELIEMLPDADKSTILGYLGGEIWTPTSAVVIDMNERYREAAERKMPDSDVIVDKFHILKKPIRRSRR